MGRSEKGREKNVSRWEGMERGKKRQERMGRESEGVGMGEGKEKRGPGRDGREGGKMKRLCKKMGSNGREGMERNNKDRRRWEGMAGSGKGMGE